MNTLHVLLPARAQCPIQGELALWCTRGDRLADVARGYLPAIAEHFSVPGAALPVAALLRDALAGDADGSGWLCADPAYVQPDMGGARLLACGTLDLQPPEAEALARELRPLFGDRGCLLETTTAGRWHLRLPRGAQPPLFTTPEQAMGDDLLQHLPEGPDGRRWRALLNEAQVVLHQHPVNAARRERGQMPANSLWFWGGGALPAWVKSELAVVVTDDVLLAALARRAGAAVAATDAVLDDLPAGDLLLDLEASTDPSAWWPRIAAGLRGRADALVLAFASGERVRYRRRHRWRLWRRIA